MANRIEIIIDSVTKGLESGLRRSHSGLAKFGKAALGAGVALSAGLAVALDQSVKAALEMQRANARLATSFKNAGLNASKYAGRVTEAESAGRKLGFSDEEIAQSLGSLITATKNYGSARKDLTIAEDVARFTGQNLAGGTKTLTMAMAGSQRALKQLGIPLVKVTKNYDALGKNATVAQKAHAKLADKMLTTKAVLEEVTKRVHGQAQAFGETATGKMKVFQAQVDNLKIQLGNALLPALEKVVGGLTRFATWLSAHPGVVKAMAVAVGILAAAFIAFSVAMFVADVAASPWIALGAAIALALIAIGAGLVYAYKHCETFRDIVKGALHVVEGAIDFVKEHWRLMLAVMLGPVGVVLGHIQSIIHALQTLWGWIKKVKDTVINIVVHFKTPGLPIFGGGGKRDLGSGSGHFNPPRAGASGGIVTRPTWAMIGERGPEALLPLSGARGASSLPGGTMTVNLNLDGKTLARVLIDPLRGEARIFEHQNGRPAF